MYLNFFFLSIVEIPGALLLWFLLKRWGLYDIQTNNRSIILGEYTANTRIYARGVCYESRRGAALISALD